MSVMSDIDCLHLQLYVDVSMYRGREYHKLSRIDQFCVPTKLPFPFSPSCSLRIFSVIVLCSHDVYPCGPSTWLLTAILRKCCRQCTARESASGQARHVPITPSATANQGVTGWLVCGQEASHGKTHFFLSLFSSTLAPRRHRHPIGVLSSYSSFPGLQGTSVPVKQDRHFPNASER